MADISCHRSDGFDFTRPAARSEWPSASRGRLSLRASTIAVIVASLLLWAGVGAVVYVVVAFG